MLKIPAMDLINGNVVRLTKGDYTRLTSYEKDPVAWAKTLETAGAKRLHIVDLDGAKAGKPLNKDVILAIKAATTLRLQVGGGVRDITTAKAYLDAGVTYVIIGSMAFKDPEALQKLLDAYGPRIIVSLDASGEQLASSGWLKKETRTIPAVLRELEQRGVETIIYTDIEGDGTLRGVNRDLYERLGKQTTLNIIAAGGVGGMRDLKSLEDTNVFGVIIGKALYEGQIDYRVVFA